MQFLVDAFGIPEDVAWWLTYPILYALAFVVALSFAHTLVLDPLLTKLRKWREQSRVADKDPMGDKKRHQIMLRKQKEYDEEVRLKAIRDREKALQKLREAEGSSSSALSGNSLKASPAAPASAPKPATTPRPAPASQQSASEVIKEQDAEFARSLQQDTQKELQKQKTRELDAETKQNRETLMKQFAAALPAEPGSDQKTCQIRIRFPNGTTAQRRFVSSAPVETILTWAASLGYIEQEYVLFFGMPKKKLLDLRNQSLEDVGLAPAAMIICEQL